MRLIDTSMWHRRDHPAVRDHWHQETLGNRVAIAPPARLEILYSARSLVEYDQLADEMDGLSQIPCTTETFERAMEVQRLLARKGGLHHRSVQINDLLIAAAAEQAGVTVWHYDSDYDKVAEITGQPTAWIVDRGSI